MIMAQKSFLVAGILLAFWAVAAGAFGAHFLRQRLTPDMLNIFEIAVRYQMYHALALIGLAWACGIFSDTLVFLSGWILFAGILIFSGSLYALVFSGYYMLGVVTPIGGTILLLGWLSFLIGVIKS